ncbi:MAG: dethiobiotin synthase [Gammaproteobacteria bacterium]|nr:dethiobiotin synthase [Gammaproteobacteria bacterium]
MARHRFFVAGTDTGVGKTTVTAALLEAGRARGLRTLAMKPVASGCDETPEGLRNEDALILQAAMTESLSYAQINPFALAPAIAPHVAAERAGVNLNAQRIIGFCRGLLMHPGDLLLIEGAGGWRVPLNARESLSAVPKALGLPVILVVGLRLGCINHALLTAEAIYRDGLRLAGWVANRCQADVMDAEADTLAFLDRVLPAPRLGLLDWQPGVSPSALAQAMDLEPLLAAQA